MVPVYDSMGNITGYVPQNGSQLMTNSNLVGNTSNFIRFSDPFNPDTTPTNLPCERYTYSIGTPQIVQTNDRLFGINNVELSSYFGANRFPDFHKIYTDGNIARTCHIIAPVYECCWVRSAPGGPLVVQSTTEIGFVELARSKALITYEECDIEGTIGKRPVILGYFSYEEIQSGPGTFVNPTNPSQAISVQTNGSITGPNWGNCYGDYSGDFFGNWFNRERAESFNFQNLSTYRTSGDYNLIDPVSGNPISGLGILADQGGCKTVGQCVKINKPSGPPEPPTDRPTVKRCIIIDSIDTARKLDNGSYTIEVDNRQYTIPFPGVNNLYVTSLIPASSKQLSPKTVQFTDANLGTFFNRSCEVGNYTVETEQFVNQFYKVEVCYDIDLLTGVIVESSRKVISDTFDGGVQDGNSRYVLDEKSVRYDENSDCCSNLQWPLDKKIQGQSQIVFLDYDYSTEISVIVKDCGCEEVTVADIYCYYQNPLTGRSERKKLKISKDAANKDTWTSPKRRVSDDRCRDKKWRVYHPIDSANDTSFSLGKDKTFGIFNGSQSLDCYLTSSITSSTSNDYYYAITDCPNCDKEPYFAVTYGNINGSGSSYVLNDPRNIKYTNDSIYTQYQLMCIEPTSSNGHPRSLPKFTFVSESISIESDDIYVINFNRKGLSNKLDPGNFQINLAYLSGSFYANNIHTGSNVKIGSSFVMTLIDDSDDYSQTYYCDTDVMTSYSIVSGTLDKGKHQPSTVNEYGKVYPSLGVIVLHPKRLNELLGFNTVTGSNVRGDNAFKLYTSISGAAAPTTGRTESYKMLGRHIKYTSTYHYSIRIGKQDANYSSNPTYASGSYNDIFERCLIKQPMTYITSIGLYDSNNDLLAVAKLSKPLKKDFDTDYLVKIRLNW